jgi:hypothetical protein
MDVALPPLGINDGGQIVIAAVDPGKEKFGWVICDDEGELILSGVSPVGEVGRWAGALSVGDREYLENIALEKKGSFQTGNRPFLLLAGSGTGSGDVIERLRRAGLEVLTVPEENTTLRGRALFWKIHPPRGLARLLPRSLTVPWRSAADMAAWCLVLEHLGRQRPENLT